MKKGKIVVSMVLTFAQNITLKMERPKPGEMSDPGKRYYEGP